METENIINQKELGSGLSKKEIELVQELIKVRQENNQGFVFEELDGYEVPPRTQFSMLRKPQLSIKDGHFTFNMACIRLFKDIQYIVPIVSKGKKRLAVIPCEEEESSSVDWARKKDGNWVNKDIMNREMCADIFQMMDWEEEARYKILGEIRMSPRGVILVFELEEAVLFASKQQEYIDEETGEVKVKRVNIKFYPDKYKGRIGMSYNDYMQTKQLNKFENFVDYFDNNGESYVGVKNEEQETTQTSDIN